MIDFTEAQRKTIASGLTVVALAVILAFSGLVIWCLVRILAFASAAVVPVVTGLFLALFFKPYYGWWLRWVRKPGAALPLMLISVLLPLGFLVWCFGSFLVDQASNLLTQAPELAEKFMAWFHGMFPKVQILANKLGISYQDWLKTPEIRVTQGGAGFIRYLGGAVSWLVALVFFAYFITRPVKRGEDYVKEMPFLKDDTRMFVAEQINTFIDIIVSFFQCQVVICLIEGVLYGTGFMLVGLPYGFVIGFALGLLNLCPFFGTIACLPLALPLAYFGPGGSLLRLVGVLSVWLAGQILDGYLITPKVQGGKTGLGYAGVIFSFFFWGAVFHSLLGLLLAIPLSAFCVVFWRALKSKYIKPVV